MDLCMGLGLVQVICRSMGYAVGSISSSPCNFYGGADLCGAKGAPVVLLLAFWNSTSPLLQALCLLRLCRA